MARMIAIPKPTKRGPKPRQRIARTRINPLKRWRSMQKLCDDTFALWVRIRDNNRCRLCGSHHITQCAHLISRRYSQCALAGENAWCLCDTCHKRYTHDPLGWDALVEAALGPVIWAQRKSNAQITTKLDYSAARLPLKLLLLAEAKSKPLAALELGRQLEKLLIRHDTYEARTTHELVRQA